MKKKDYFYSCRCCCEPNDPSPFITLASPDYNISLIIYYIYISGIGRKKTEVGTTSILIENLFFLDYLPYVVVVVAGRSGLMLLLDWTKDLPPPEGQQPRQSTSNKKRGSKSSTSLLLFLIPPLGYRLCVLRLLCKVGKKIER